MTDTFELVDKPELSISLFAVFLAAISLPVIIATFAYAPYEKKYAAGKPASFLLITIIISLMATNFIINHNRSHPTVEKISNTIHEAGYTVSTDDILDHTRTEGDPPRIDMENTVRAGNPIPMERDGRSCKGVPVNVNKFGNRHVNLDVTCE